MKFLLFILEPMFPNQIEIFNYLKLIIILNIWQLYENKYY